MYEKNVYVLCIYKTNLKHLLYYLCMNGFRGCCKKKEKEKENSQNHLHYLVLEREEGYVV